MHLVENIKLYIMTNYGVKKMFHIEVIYKKIKFKKFFFLITSFFDLIAKKYKECFPRIVALFV